MLSKSQQVFASAHKDFQRLTWNFHSEDQENAIANEAAHLIMESCKVEKILIHGKRTYSRHMFSVR